MNNCVSSFQHNYGARYALVFLAAVGIVVTGVRQRESERLLQAEEDLFLFFHITLRVSSGRFATLVWLTASIVCAMSIRL